MTADRLELKGWGKNQLIAEVLRLRRVLDQQLASGPALGDVFEVQGVVHAGDRQPAVQWRCGEAAGEFSSLGKAVDHGRAVITAAVEAERDAATIAFLDETGLSADRCGAFLEAMREHRLQFVDGIAARAAASPKPDGGAR